MADIGHINLAMAIRCDANRIIKEPLGRYHRECAVWSKSQDSLVAGIGEIDNTPGSKRDTARTVKPAVPLGDLPAIRCQRLHTMVPGIGNPNPAIRPDRDARRIAKLRRPVTFDT